MRGGTHAPVDRFGTMAKLTLTKTSDLPVPPEAVLSTLDMEGVNDELAPFVQMTAPDPWNHMPIAEWRTGSLLFKSWILLFGFLPIDRHSFMLESVEPGKGFQEASSSWMNKTWRHYRSVEETTSGCRVTDSIEYEPRVPLLSGLQKFIIERIFDNRHKNLKKAFDQ